MNKFDGVKCPICEKELQQKDDVVVCPDCGAPYHRECIIKEDHCVFEDKHSQGFVWKKPEPKRPEFNTAQEQLRCSRCGTLNKYESLFCEVCGTPLIKNGQDNNPSGQQPFGINQNMNNPNNIPPNIHFIPYNPFTTPFGGLSPDEEIDGISVKELAIFLGENTHYFIPKFKEMKTNNKNTWNWASVFLSYFYFIYRKMWGFAVVAFIISMVLMAPNLIYTVRSLSVTDTSVATQTGLFFLSFLSFALRVTLGLYTNKWYMNHVFNKIRKIKKEYGDTPRYNEMLIKYGSVSKVGVLIAASVYFMMSMVLGFVLYFFTLI
ncbi:MAG: hypothetical protein K0R90_8 [Oscillospiraceae bacterium]|jgi:DNA-directed RNA polymerase subunit RPC12/RpoP|nr:hypothetical protein [Oscillospiraceae bacterium]